MYLFYFIVYIYSTSVIEIKTGCIFFAAGPKNYCQGIFVSKIISLFAKTYWSVLRPLSSYMLTDFCCKKDFFDH